MRQIGCANPKLRFWNAQIIIKIITRAREIAIFRRAPLFADTSAYGRGEPCDYNNMRAPDIARRGENRSGFPFKSRYFAADSSARNARTNSLAQAKRRFCVSAPLFAKTFAYAGKVNAARVNTVCPEKARRRGKLRLSRT